MEIITKQIVSCSFMDFSCFIKNQQIWWYVHIYTKNINHQQMHKESFIINCKYTLLHVSTLLGHLQGETFRCLYTRFHPTVEWECAVDCVLRCFWRRELFVVSACTAVRHKEFTPPKAAQYTVNSPFLLNCIVQPIVKTTESFSLKVTYQGRNM
jgi:hypothetical protein